MNSQNAGFLHTNLYPELEIFYSFFFSLPSYLSSSGIFITFNFSQPFGVALILLSSLNPITTHQLLEKMARFSRQLICITYTLRNLDSLYY